MLQRRYKSRNISLPNPFALVPAETMTFSPLCLPKASPHATQICVINFLTRLDTPWLVKEHSWVCAGCNAVLGVSLPSSGRRTTVHGFPIPSNLASSPSERSAGGRSGLLSATKAVSYVCLVMSRGWIVPPLPNVIGLSTGQRSSQSHKQTLRTRGLVWKPAFGSKHRGNGGTEGQETHRAAFCWHWSSRQKRFRE